MSPPPRTLLEGAKFRVVEHQLEGPAAPIRRQIVEHPGAVAILPMLPDDRVCLIRNHRLAVGRTLIELPAGTLEPEELPAQAAVRELQEETGYTAADWQPLPACFMSPGILHERMHFFVAQGLTAGAPARAVDETIDNFIVAWPEAVAMALRGEIEDAKSLVGILLWDRLRVRYRGG